jgi:hypothetical protein
MNDAANYQRSFNSDGRSASAILTIESIGNNTFAAMSERGRNTLRSTYLSRTQMYPENVIENAGIADATVAINTPAINA